MNKSTSNVDGACVRALAHASLAAKNRVMGGASPTSDMSLTVTCNGQGIAWFLISCVNRLVHTTPGVLCHGSCPRLSVETLLDSQNHALKK